MFPPALPARTGRTNREPQRTRTCNAIIAQSGLS
nr:MAG TPA: hypothetical protein [Caudoviricetes sp.]